MVIPSLKKKLCRDLLLEEASTDTASVAVTSFSYPNGDSVNLYFSDLGDTIGVSDEGATVAFLRTQGVDFTAERRSAIKTMCRPHDVEFVTPVLRKQFQMPEIATACMALCEAISIVASIYYHVGSPARSSLPLAVDKLLRARVEPKRAVQRGWTSLRHDPKASFPVDFHVNGIGEPRNIFSVTSPSKCIMVVAVINFLKSHRLSAPSMAIVDKDADLGTKDLNRLQLTANQLTFGLHGKEDRVVDFALSGSGKN
jgi:hypothetical protein